MPGLAGEVANLIVALKLDDSGFSGKLNAISGRLRGFDSSLSRVGRGVGQVGSGLARIGTVAATAAAGGLAAVVTTAASFEQAFTGIEKTVDATDAQFAALEEQFRSMARTIPVSFEELAAIGEAGGALGIAREDLLDFTDVVARLSVSTNLSSDQAATALGQLGNVLHLSGGDFRDFADSLVALGNAGASTEDQIVQMAARFGAAGNAAGLTKEEILALSSATASMGIQVEAGGSALSRIFSAVATNIGTSSSKAAAFADTLNLSAAEFRRAWERDALGTFQDFLRELNKLDQFEAASLLKDVGITNVRDVNTVRLMAQNVGFVAEQLKIADDAQGSLNKESQKFFDTAQGQWQTLKNNIRDAGVTIGNEVLPITKELIQDFTEWLNTPEMRTGLKQFGQDLADGIRSIVTELKGTDFSGLLGGLKIAADAAKVAFDAFRSLPGPLQGAIVAAIALNKVSGGGVGLLLRGVGNIALGTGGGLARLFGGLRGQTPANPQYVAVVGGLPGVGGGVGGAAGGRGFWAGAGKILGLAAGGVLAVEVGNLIGHLVFDPTVKPAVQFERSQFDEFVDAASGNPQELQRAIDAIQSGLDDMPLAAQLFAREQIGILERQRDHLKELLAVAQEQQAAAFENNQTEADLLNEAKQQRLAQAAQTQAVKDLTLEQRLIRDKGFKAKIDADEFLRVLRRTSEFGAKGEGTRIELGPRTGRDPTGQAFVALVRRLTAKELADTRVQGEIKRHIIAAKEVLAAAQESGDKETARQLRETIGQLKGILRSTDNTGRKTDTVASKVSEASRAIGASRQAVLDMGGRTVGYLSSINAKDFSPQVNVNASFTANVLTAAGQIIQQTRIEQAISGTGGVGGPVPSNQLTA